MNLKIPLPFGKYRGQALDSIDDWEYLRWCLREVDLDARQPGLYSAVREYLARNGELND